MAEHPRCYGRGETIYDPWHYVPVLARKPGALRNGARSRTGRCRQRWTACGPSLPGPTTATGRYDLILFTHDDVAGIAAPVAHGVCTGLRVCLDAPLTFARRVPPGHRSYRCQRCDRAGSYRLDGLLARFGPNAALPDVLLAGHLRRRKASLPPAARDSRPDICSPAKTKSADLFQAPLVGYGESRRLSDDDQWPLCANTGHSAMACQTGQILNGRSWNGGTVSRQDVNAVLRFRFRIPVIRLP